MNIENGNRRLKVLDLFAGFGGASEAFVRAGDEVYRIENNLKIIERGYGANTIFIDVNDLDLTESRFQDLDLIISGLPCQEFSLAFNSQRSRKERAGKVHFPSLAGLELTIHIIETLQPKHYIIENVAGAVKYFKPYLGKKTQKIGAQNLWHNLNCLITIPADSKVHTKQELDTHGGDPLRSNERAKWPFDLSQALRDTFSQTSMLDFGDEI